MKYSEYSVIVVGSGAAGLYAALKISQQINLPDGLLLLTKSELGESNSLYAQGGIVAVMKDNKSDSVSLHVDDTIRAGVGLNNREAVEYISQASDEVIKDLMNSGVSFDKDDAGNLMYTLEAAHSTKRILHSGGDATGRGITTDLCKAVRSCSNIDVLENSIVVELLVDSKKVCKGVILYNEMTGEHEIVYAAAVVLATGGCGQLYKYTTNPKGATGDGIDLAFHAGAEIKDMEFIQFHPTALALSADNKNRFLISEAVRGEGAVLLNHDGNQFMKNYHDKRELAPRDIVTRAIYSEMKKEHSSNVYLNASMINPQKLFNRFPTISKRCKDNGIDISKVPIPVAPAAHYTMGGIKASVEGRTTISGLYAIGEVASTGLHGANRLASNSLLECVVCAYELADYLSFANLVPPKKIDDSIRNVIDLYSLPLSDEDYLIEEQKGQLKEIMWQYVGILRDDDGLSKALDKLELLKKGFKRNRKCANIEEYEYRNMLTVAELIIKAAKQRKESIGAHCRSDYPNNTKSLLETNEKEKRLLNVK